MRTLLFLTVLTTAALAFEYDELYKEAESFDSIFEKKAYIAFKLKNSKLERRVTLAQELSRGAQKAIKDKKIHDMTTSFVPPTSLELRLGTFYYDEAEHGARINATFAEIAKSLCASYPRHLTFDRFLLDNSASPSKIRGHLQNGQIGNEGFGKILLDAGFVYRAVHDVQGAEKSGFVVVKSGALYKTSVTERGKVKETIEIHPAAKIFLQKPLRTSVYVDTLSICRENIFGNCDEIAHVKIESCKKATTVVTPL